MEERIKKLKDLRIAHECATNYDYVPDTSQTDSLLFEVLPVWLKVTKEQLENVLSEYEGNSPGNIVTHIMDVIDGI